MIPELTLTGPARQRGQAHGEAVRGLIGEAVERWFADLRPRTDPTEFVMKIVHDSGLGTFARNHTPDLVEEVQGIAEGSNQSFETMFAWQLIDECWWYLDEITGERESHEACSAMAVNAGGWGCVAQTQDLYRNHDGAQVFLRYIDDDGLEILVPSAAGLLAYNGVNSAGLAVCITTLSQLPTQTNGASSGFVVPSLLRCRTIDEALEWLRDTPLASGNSWILGTNTRSVVVEASASSVDIVHDGDLALHTNHTLVQQGVADYVRFASSEARFDQLQATVRADMTLNDVIAMYGTSPVCQSRSQPDDVISVATAIFELGNSFLCHFAPGPLDTDELVTYEMSTTAPATPTNLGDPS